MWFAVLKKLYKFSSLDMFWWLTDCLQIYFAKNLLVLLNFNLKRLNVENSFYLLELKALRELNRKRCTGSTTYHIIKLNFRRKSRVLQSNEQKKPWYSIRTHKHTEWGVKWKRYRRRHWKSERYHLNGFVWVQLRALKRIEIFHMFKIKWNKD